MGINVGEMNRSVHGNGVSMGYGIANNSYVMIENGGVDEDGGISDEKSVEDE